MSSETCTERVFNIRDTTPFNTDICHGSRFIFSSIFYIFLKIVSAFYRVLFLNLEQKKISIGQNKNVIFIVNSHIRMCSELIFYAFLLLNFVPGFNILHRKFIGKDHDPSSTWSSMSFPVSPRTLAPASFNLGIIEGLNIMLTNKIVRIQ